MCGVEKLCLDFETKEGKEKSARRKRQWSRTKQTYRLTVVGVPGAGANNVGSVIVIIG